MRRIALAAVALALSACGGSDGLTERSTCQEFLDSTDGERAQLVLDMAEGRAGDHGTVGAVQVMLQAERECVEDRDMRLRDVPALQFRD